LDQLEYRSNGIGAVGRKSREKESSGTIGDDNVQISCRLFAQAALRTGGYKPQFVDLVFGASPEAVAFESKSSAKPTPHPGFDCQLKVSGIRTPLAKHEPAGGCREEVEDSVGE
jgi:hypothetical protein